MANARTTHIDYGRGELRDTNARYHDEIISFAAAGELRAGTILARRTADQRLVAFEVGGADGAGVPLCILPRDLSAEAAGDVPARVMVTGAWNAHRLIIAVDGDASRVTPAILDQLRSAGVDSDFVTQLGRPDPNEAS